MKKDVLKCRQHALRCCRIPNLLRAFTSLALTLTAWQVAAQARACPDCNIGRVARQLVWTDDFVANMATAVSPFVLLAAASIWVDRIK